MWSSLSGSRVPDIVHAVRSLASAANRVVHIGTDAKHRGFHTDFVTVITVLNPGHGGRVFYRRQRQSRMRSLAQKLFREAELSLDVAQMISDEITQDVFVHVDANEDTRHKSSKYVQALSGMVIGYGFQVLVKPHAWCASHVADFVVKEKHLKAA
ncbi:MAG: hypothetical protein O7B99_09930 [Planctomycetota bacterium]|nr:hypothetical protein [Planctomycetota bacterium]